MEKLEELQRSMGRVEATLESHSETISEIRSDVKRIDDKIGDIASTLVRNTDSLEEHMRRTDVLEKHHELFANTLNNRLKPIEDHVVTMRTSFKYAIAIGIFVAGVLGCMEGINVIVEWLAPHQVASQPGRRTMKPDPHLPNGNTQKEHR